MTRLSRRKMWPRKAPLFGSIAAGALLTLGATAGPFTAPALADHDQPPPTAPLGSAPSPSKQLARLEAKALKAITARVNVLSSAMAKVQADSFLGADGTTLVNQMQADINGLRQLEATMISSPSLQQAVPDFATVFTGYRVYHLVLPVARLVVATDFLDNVQLADLKQDVADLQAYVNSYNQSYLAPLFSDAQAQLSSATAATSGLTAQLLSYTPAQWDANHALLSTAYTNVHKAERAAKSAQHDTKKIYKYFSRPLSLGDQGAQGNQQQGH